MTRIERYFLAIMMCSPSGFAAVNNVNVQTTSTQAILSFTVSDPAQCLVQVYSDAALTQLADDPNSTLFSGAQRCNRNNSALQGSKWSLVAGLRTAQNASNAKI